MSTMASGWAAGFVNTEAPFARRREPTPDAAHVEAGWARLAAIARLMDNAFVIPGLGVRIGLDALVGLLPVGGEAITTAVQLYIVWEARRLGATRTQVAQMLGNVALDAIVGLVPIVGDVFDIGWKANIRNLRIMGIECGTPRGAARRGV